MSDRVLELQAAAERARAALDRARAERKRTHGELRRAFDAHDRAKGSADPAVLKAARQAVSLAGRADVAARQAERAASDAERKARVAVYYAAQKDPRRTRPSHGLSGQELIDMLIELDGVPENVAERMSNEDLRISFDRILRR
jgi:hypothetical protein